MRIGSVEIVSYEEGYGTRIDVRHELPAEPYDKAMNVVGRSEIVLTIADFWEKWDDQAKKDFALALTYIAGEMVRSLPQLQELTP
jgi:hypothetical protein